jgi:hypothetical protein
MMKKWGIQWGDKGAPKRERDQVKKLHYQEAVDAPREMEWNCFPYLRKRLHNILIGCSLLLSHGH